MNPSKDKLDEKLADLEVILSISEHDLELELKKLKDPNISDDSCKEWTYEVTAFSFCENYTDQTTGWGTYFGPALTLSTDDGSINEIPSIRWVNDEVLSYWSDRAQSTNNPFMQARYAGLVWDLSEKATGKKPNYLMAVKYCEAVLRIAEIINHDCSDDLIQSNVDVIQKLERALLIAISISNQTLINDCKETILNYEDYIAEDNKPGLWGFSFDFLVESKKVNLSVEEEREIIEALEARLTRLKDSEPWICESAADRLARYYRSRGQVEECNRVIRTLGHTFETTASTADPLTASSLLEQIHNIYIQFNLLDDAERIRIMIRENGPKIQDSMIEIVHKIDLSSEDLESYITQMLDGDCDAVLARIATQYIPKREEAERQLRYLATQAPLSFLFTKQLSDTQGRIIATIGTLEDDLDGNIVSQISQNMIVSAMFLSTVLERAVEKFIINSNELVEYLYRSPVFKSDQKNFMIKGIESYLSGDYMVAIHLLIPQIEATLRNLVEISGGAVLKRGRGGSFQLRTLDELLRTEQIMQVFNEDVALYFRVVLTDQRGWNIRNNVCHGLSQEHQFSKEVAERLIHVLLVMALVREQHE